MKTITQWADDYVAILAEGVFGREKKMRMIRTKNDRVE